MADQLSIDSLQIDRDALAGFLPDLRSIKAFEQLQKSVSDTLPTAINQNATAIGQITEDMDASSSTALNALCEAAIAMQSAQEAITQALCGQLASLTSELAVARSQIADLEMSSVQVASLVSEVASLRAQINDLNQGVQL